jgi:hypothetical protein
MWPKASKNLPHAPLMIRFFMWLVGMTTIPIVQGTVLTPAVSGFLPGGHGPLSTRYSRVYITDLQNHLSKQLRPLPPLQTPAAFVCAGPQFCLLNSESLCDGLETISLS